MSDAWVLVLFGFAHIEVRESYRVCMIRRWFSGRFCEPSDTIQAGGFATQGRDDG